MVDGTGPETPRRPGVGGAHRQAVVLITLPLVENCDMSVFRLLRKLDSEAVLLPPRAVTKL